MTSHGEAAMQEIYFQLAIAQAEGLEDAANACAPDQSALRLRLEDAAQLIRALHKAVMEK